MTSLHHWRYLVNQFGGNNMLIVHSSLLSTQNGEGTSKRHWYYEVHTFRMGGRWYLNRKIKIYWPLIDWGFLLSDLHRFRSHNF